MQLKSIHFSGFKSFVDPTTFKLPANIIGVVGPNGCGKSNVIDAVRWVMGESSAKTLRGDSMADVIFNGSTSRQPVGKASVELLFDNSAGRAPGAYSQYAEISVKRSLSRDGQSDYYLNNVRCRRKDITEIFLGTGLGPRSYSIIEQGMVNRIVESRPEDLRMFVEEAAGISKYKEKRRETENRIRHTRENLERVEDIIRELETQLRRLDRQSRQAQRYKELKAQQRELKAQTLALTWQQYQHRLVNFDVEVSRREKEQAGYVAAQRENERSIEALRVQLTQAQEMLNQTQGQFYSVGADITAIEQQIQHTRETRQRQLEELKRIEDEISQAEQRLSEDTTRHEQLSLGHQRLSPQVDRLREDHARLRSALSEKEQALQQWQHDWERFQDASHQSVKDRDVLKAQINHLTGRQQEIQARKQSIGQQSLDVVSDIDQIEPRQLREQAQEQDRLCQEIENNIAGISIEINELRDKIKVIDDKLKLDTKDSIEVSGKLESVMELQRAALGEDDEQFSAWLSSTGLSDSPRLTSLLEVEPGWEKAVDTALSTRTASLCVDNLDAWSDQARQMEHVDLNFVESVPQANGQDQPVNKLLSKIESPIDLGGILNHVFLADSQASALGQRSQLNDNQILITADGTQVGRNWITIAKKHDVQSGVIERERLINLLTENKEQLQAVINGQEQQRSTIRVRLNQLEETRSQQSIDLARENTKRSVLHKQLGQQEEKIRELGHKKQVLEEEFGQLAVDLEQTTSSLGKTRSQLENIETSVTSNAQNRQQLENLREQITRDLNAVRADVEHVRELLDNDNVRLEKMSTALESLDSTIERTREQLDTLANRKTENSRLIEDSPESKVDNSGKLQALLASRGQVEQQLQDARNAVSGIDVKISEQDRGRQENEQKAMDLRNQLESSRLEKQEVVVKQQAVHEQLVELGEDIQVLVRRLPEQAEVSEYRQNLEQLEQKLDRLGTVNLLAIEEYDEQQQRKVYLDKQHEDLSKALETLEDVMRKIDRETRQRFRETFEKLNAGFKEFFPRLFGGGSASLELTDDDLLSTGVTVMARPPGKRNSTIHLLSGGEKALTAVSLLFSLFQLNPSPLCILDEVDAPLDDANVERYCRTLLQMAEHTQLIFITHNKITMEYANLLIGVTMQEPGVSRLVAVDVEKALEFAEQV